MTEQELRDFIKEELKSIKKEVKEGIEGYWDGNADSSNDKIFNELGYDFGHAAAVYYEWMSEEDQEKLTELIDYSDDKKGLKELTNMLMKYQKQLKKLDVGINDKKAIENFAKWYSPDSWALSEGTLNEEYNGWTNWDTWNANNWLTNDEGAYGQAMKTKSELTLKKFFIERFGKGHDDINIKKVNWDEIWDGLHESKINEGFSTWEVEFGRGKVSGVDYAKAGKVSVKARNTVEAIKKAVKQVGNADDWMVVDIENLRKI